MLEVTCFAVREPTFVAQIVVRQRQGFGWGEQLIATAEVGESLENDRRDLDAELLVNDRLRQSFEAATIDTAIDATITTDLI